MRYLLLAAGVAAVSVAAQAQNTAWGFYDGDDGSSLAGVQAADGSQLMVKCDKPGRGNVYAVIVSPKRLVPPAQRFVRRPIKLRFDGGRTIETRWRYFDQTATAVDAKGDAELEHLLVELVGAKQFDVELQPLDGLPIPLTFDVTGAREALSIVYDKCKDTSPVALAAAG